jgi:hypothetical protein
MSRREEEPRDAPFDTGDTETQTRSKPALFLLFVALRNGREGMGVTCVQSRQREADISAENAAFPNGQVCGTIKNTKKLVWCHFVLKRCGVRLLRSCCPNTVPMEEVVLLSTIPTKKKGRTHQHGGKGSIDTVVSIARSRLWI